MSNKIILSYNEYCHLCGRERGKHSWIEWKMYLGMSYEEAFKAYLEIFVKGGEKL